MNKDNQGVELFDLLSRGCNLTEIEYCLLSRKNGSDNFLLVLS